MKTRIIMITIFMFLLAVHSVSALSWQKNGTETMNLDDFGNLRIIGNHTLRQELFFETNESSLRWGLTGLTATAEDLVIVDYSGPAGSETYRQSLRIRNYSNAFAVSGGQEDWNASANLHVRGSATVSLPGTVDVGSGNVAIDTSNDLTSEILVGDALRISNGSDNRYYDVVFANATNINVSVLPDVNWTGAQAFKDGNLSRIDNAFGTVKLFVDKTGNVGIGSTPGTKLAVNGSITLSTNKTSVTNGTVRFTGSDFEGFMSNSWYSLTGGFWRDNATTNTLYTFNLSKNVGVGTNNASANLHIKGTALVNLSGTVNVSSGNTVINTSDNLTSQLSIGDAIRLTNGTITRSYEVAAITATNITLNSAPDVNLTNATAYTDSDFFKVDNAFGTEKFVIDESGNVGVGAVPRAKLDVNGSIIVGVNQTSMVNGSIRVNSSTGDIEGMINGSIYSLTSYPYHLYYETDWNKPPGGNDWTQTSLGSINATRSNVTHNLDAPLKDLQVNLYLKDPDGKIFEIRETTRTCVSTCGYAIYDVDNNNFDLVTGDGGLHVLRSDGSSWQIDSENDWHYKVVVTKKHSLIAAKEEEVNRQCTAVNPTSSYNSWSTNYANATGRLLTIPNDGEYSVYAEETVHVYDTNDNKSQCEIRLALNGVGINGTARTAYLTDGGGTSVELTMPMHIEHTGIFNAGDIITVQVKQDSGDQCSLLYAAGEREPTLKAERLMSVAAVRDIAGEPSPYAVIEDRKPNGTSGGTSTGGTWDTRDLTKIVTRYPDTNWVTLANNQFTLEPGRYHIEASAPMWGDDNHKIILNRVGDASGTATLIGTSEYAPHDTGTANSQTRSFLDGYIDINTSTSYQIQHYTSGGGRVNGLGQPTSIAGLNETYTTVHIERLE